MVVGCSQAQPGRTEVSWVAGGKGRESPGGGGPPPALTQGSRLHCLVPPPRTHVCPSYRRQGGAASRHAGQRGDCGTHGVGGGTTPCWPRLAPAS